MKANEHATRLYIFLEVTTTVPKIVKFLSVQIQQRRFAISQIYFGNAATQSYFISAKLQCFLTVLKVKSLCITREGPARQRKMLRLAELPLLNRDIPKKVPPDKEIKCVQEGAKSRLVTAEPSTCLWLLFFSFCMVFYVCYSPSDKGSLKISLRYQQSITSQLSSAT